LRVRGRELAELVDLEPQPGHGLAPQDPRPADRAAAREQLGRSPALLIQGRGQPGVAACDLDPVQGPVVDADRLVGEAVVVAQPPRRGRVVDQEGPDREDHQPGEDQHEPSHRRRPGQLQATL